MKKKYTVITYIFGGYEKLHEVEELDPTADYVLITDRSDIKSETWRVVRLQENESMSPFGKCYTVRFHPFDYVDTDIMVRIDGSIAVKKSLRPIVDEFIKGKYDRCLMIHPHRNTQPVEYDAWVRCRNYPAAQAARCLQLMRRMSSAEFVETYKGLYQGCFEIQRKNDINDQINDLTFGLLSLMGKGCIERIDQTVTSFVINRFYENRLKVLAVAEDIVTDGKLMQWHFHNSDTPVKQNPATTDLMLFNQPAKIWVPTASKKKAVK